MPTAVERGFNFLKLDGIDGRHEQAAVNNAFDTIGFDILKLSTAVSADDFFKYEHSPAIKHDFHVVGDYFLKLGEDFTEISNRALKIDEIALKIEDVAGKFHGGGTASAATVDGPNLQADFRFCDGSVRTAGMDLKLLGGDFLKLDTAREPSFDHKLGDVATDFLKLGADMANSQKGFSQLSADFLKIEAPGELLPAVYKELGGDLRIVADEFGALSVDFLKLGGLLKFGNTDGGGFNSDTAALLGSDLKILNADFLKLDQALGALSGPSSEAFHALIGLL